MSQNLYKTRHAFRESISDTALAFAMNVPIGFGIIAFANAIGIITVTTSENVQLVILQNIVFTTVAIIRKTYVRLWFERRKERKNAKLAKK